jgi:CRISPR-associated endonuclease Cas2
MGGKPKSAPDYMAVLRKLKQACIGGAAPINTYKGDMDDMPVLEDRVDRILGIINDKERPASNMLFFVMYDIESNKVRYNVVKYLIAKGCTRIQKSIFLADLPSDAYDAIKQDLAEVQALYDNHDSIIVCPVSADMLGSMKIIGQSINLDIILHNKSTLFF